MVKENQNKKGYYKSYCVTRLENLVVTC